MNRLTRRTSLSLAAAALLAVGGTVTLQAHAGNAGAFLDSWARLTESRKSS